MMKKNNKKGFTLAELLIVIAIIAILIAIAIPAFSASLHSARLQTDHGNIRSAYAMYKTAEMLGVLEGIEADDLAASTSYYFTKQGSLSTTVGDAYVLQTKGEGTECDASIGCTLGSNKHEEGYVISISYTQDAAGVKTWAFNVAAKP